MSAITRTLAFFSKWSAEIVRQPALMVTLVIGPFLVLLAFGQGVEVEGPKPRVIIVEQPGPDEALQPLPEELNQNVDVVGQTQDEQAARKKLKDGDIDGILIIPRDPEGTVKRGEQVPIRVVTDEIDPVRKSYAKSYLSDQVATLNRQTIAKAVGDAQGSLKEVQQYIGTAREYVGRARGASGNIDTVREQVRNLKDLIAPISSTSSRVASAINGAAFVVPGLSGTKENVDRLNGLVSSLERDVNSLDAQVNGPNGGALPSDADLAKLEDDLNKIDSTAATVSAIPPDVLSAPFKLQLENIAPFVPTFAAFYAPAVLALLLQHLAITLGALSLARIRLIGLMDVLRASPVRASEVVTGNYLSYGLLCVIAGALLVTLTVTLLDVPVFGSYVALATGLLLLVLASLGIGFVISLLSSSEQQAAQISMLILLCAIFFSGFVFAVDRVTWPVRAISYVLPATFAIRNFQDVMLRGDVRYPIDLVILGAVAVVFFGITLLLFRREFRPA